MRRPCCLPVLLLAAACAHAPPPVTPNVSHRDLALPGATGEVSLDYLFFDRTARRLWVPAGNTGNVDVYDVASDRFAPVGGFKVVEVERHGHKRQLGPSSVTQGDGVVYVGDRGSSEVCAIDEKELKTLGCVTLPSPPDGIAYVAKTKEVWVTTPREKSLTLLDASAPAAPALKGKIELDGEPEGYAVDPAHGLFFTNLEDKDRTLGFDVATRQKLSDWSPGCGEKGPRGIALDLDRRFAFVACTDAVTVLDVTHEGAVLARADTGAGVDNIDFVEPMHQLYVAAGKDARLTIFGVGELGKLTSILTTGIPEGSRVVVADALGTAYVADPKEGRIVVVTPP